MWIIRIVLLVLLVVALELVIVRVAFPPLLLVDYKANRYNRVAGLIVSTMRPLVSNISKLLGVLTGRVTMPRNRCSRCEMVVDQMGLWIGRVSW